MLPALGYACTVSAGLPDRSGTSGETIGTIGGRYELGDILGHGGTATVYRATDLRLGHTVAVKVLHSKHPTADRRMEREARVAAALRHPNVCIVTDYGRLEDRTPYLVMELLVGRSLRDLLDEAGSLDATQVHDIGEQVLSVLHVAHQRGVIHRDIKPDNLFLSDVVGRPPLVKLLDFGIASADYEEGLTTKGNIVGTPAYMSPEQVIGAPDIDGRSDIYSCAVVMYECLTGLAPYRADTRRALMDKILRGGAPSIASLRPDLAASAARAIDQAMRVEREPRFTNALAMLAVLDGRADLPEGNWEAETERFGPGGAPLEGPPAASPLPSFDLDDSPPNGNPRKSSPR
jgi:serine/threonine protein kinase